MLYEEQSLLGWQSRGLMSDYLSRTGQQTTVLGRISFRERWVNRELINILVESFYHCIECSASNFLATLMWSDTWTVTFSLSATHKDFRKVLMEQVSRLAIWSTHEELRWKRKGEYKGDELPYKGDHQKNQEKSLCNQEL